MEDERKNLLVAGICLGDIALAMAAVGDELPPYAAGLDVDNLLAACSDVGSVKAEVDKELSEETDGGTLSPRMLKAILERAIASGKFLSAARCLELLGDKDAYVGRYLDEARRDAAGGMTAKAARALVIAANLDLGDAIPGFQYKGPGLHDACASTPENCITRMERENAVLRAFKYLLPSERVHQAVSEIPQADRAALLVQVVLERDPHAREFIEVFEKAHLDLADTEKRQMGGLASRAKKVEEEVKKFADSLGRIPTRSEEEKETLERLRLTVGGLTRELAGLGELVRGRQFRSLTRRFEQLVGSLEEIEEAERILGSSGGSAGQVFEPILALIRETVDQNILEQVKEIEQRLLSAQVTMLGRSVHSHEHWQYLRELAFKYPASPLVCCVSRINDRWMVVPVWGSPVAEILRAGFGNEAESPPPASQPADEERASRADST